MTSFGRRLALTLGVPAALAWVWGSVSLPGIPADIAENAPMQQMTGVFTLGIMPIVSAYILVEVVAYLVPRWSRLRHGNPEGRAKLERVVPVVAVLLAAVQAFGLTMALADISDPPISIPFVAVSLVGGVCVLSLVARFLTRHGLINGFVLVSAVATLRAVVPDTLTRLGLADLFHLPERRLRLWASTVVPVEGPRQMAGAVLAIAVVAFATWAALRGGAAPSEPAERGPRGGAPYRGARQRVVHPWIPIPASSFQVYFVVWPVVQLPATLAAFHVPTGPVQELVAPGSVGYTIASLAVLGVVVLVVAMAIHRPAEMADLAQRLGVRSDERENRAALRRALAGTALFFLAFVLATLAGDAGDLAAVVVLVAVLFDLTRSIRAERAAPTLVTVWEERRASAVPVLSAALAEAGIAVEPRGMAIASLSQIFAPFAPVELRVRAEDAERATATLRHLLLGEEAPPRTDGAPVASPVAGGWPPRRLAAALVASAAAAGLAIFLTASRAEPLLGPRPELAVVRVDDAVDAFSQQYEDEGDGIAVYWENVPLGRGRSASSHFARLAFRPGETRAAAAQRFRAWLAPIALPPGRRFGVQPVFDDDPRTRRPQEVGLRTFVLAGPPVLGTDDVTDAAVGRSVAGDSTPYVAVTLSPAGAQRFERATREWMQRRMAIEIDGVIDSAPVIKAAIGGGHLSISLGAGDPEQQIGAARRLAGSLRPH